MPPTALTATQTAASDSFLSSVLTSVATTSDTTSLSSFPLPNPAATTSLATPTTVLSSLPLLSHSAATNMAAAAVLSFLNSDLSFPSTISIIHTLLSPPFNLAPKEVAHRLSTNTPLSSLTPSSAASLYSLLGAAAAINPTSLVAASTLSNPNEAALSNRNSSTSLQETFLNHTSNPNHHSCTNPTPNPNVAAAPTPFYLVAAATPLLSPNPNFPTLLYDHLNPNPNSPLNPNPNYLAAAGDYPLSHLLPPPPRSHLSHFPLHSCLIIYLSCKHNLLCKNPKFLPTLISQILQTHLSLYQIPNLCLLNLQMITILFRSINLRYFSLAMISWDTLMARFNDLNQKF